MPQSDTAALVSSVIGVTAVTLLTVPAVKQFLGRLTARRSSQYHQLSDKYEDEDGVATPESQNAYSVQLQRILLIVIAVVGTLESLIAAILATSRRQIRLPTEQWLSFVSWVGATASCLA